MPPGPQGDPGLMPVGGIGHHGPQFSAPSDVYEPRVRVLDTYSGINIGQANLDGLRLERARPDVPSHTELGNIDVHALTRSLQSGIHGEVRVALDTLGTLSVALDAPKDPYQDLFDPRDRHFRDAWYTDPARKPATPHLYVQLRYCEDLIEALVDCAEEQVELLAEHAEESSADIQMVSYEDVVRACRQEQFALREDPVFGTLEHELNVAVDRLISITTILRNLSFPAPGESNYDNQFFLSDESVVKFLCVVIRYVVTRHLLLWTQGLLSPGYFHRTGNVGKKDNCVLHKIQSIGMCPQ